MAAQQVAPKFAQFEFTDTGEVVAAVTGKRIRVIGFIASASAADEVAFQDDATSPNILVQLDVPADTPFGWVGSADCPLGETAVGQALDVDATTGTTIVKGTVTYIEV